MEPSQKVSLSLKRRLMKLKFRCIKCLTCGVKTVTLLFWVSLYFLVMKLTIFKSTGNITVSTPKDWTVIPDNNTYSEVETVDPNDPVFEEIFMSLIEPKNETVAILKTRAEQTQKTCLKYSLRNQTVNIKEFFVDNEHHLVWCNIFKAASTMWLHNFNILGGYGKNYLSHTPKMPLALARKKFPPPSLEELTSAVRQPRTISFLIVREPFVRLLSGYRDKIENMTRPYYRKMAKAIIRKQRKTTKKSLGGMKQRGPTFYEFVADLIEKNKKQKPLDEHWTPYYKFCSPCAVNFGVIGKVETVERDSAYVIHELGLSRLFGRLQINTNIRKKMMNKSRDGKITSNLIKHYYSQLTEEMLNDLLSIYGIDFEMFGYDTEIYRNLTRNKNSKDML